MVQKGLFLSTIRIENIYREVVKKGQNFVHLFIEWLFFGLQTNQLEGFGIYLSINAEILQVLSLCSMLILCWDFSFLNCVLVQEFAPLS